MSSPLEENLASPENKNISDDMFFSTMTNPPVAADQVNYTLGPFF